MTSLQIDYWKLKESERTNKANEGLRAGELAETTRHNQATEAIAWAQVGETTRHNQATEQVQIFSAQTDRIRANDWRNVQQDQIALQRDANDIARERNKISALETELGYKRFELDQAVRTAELDIAQQNLDLAKSDNRRKWVGTIFKDVIGETIGWFSGSSPEGSIFATD